MSYNKICEIWNINIFQKYVAEIFLFKLKITNQREDQEGGDMGIYVCI